MTLPFVLDTKATRKNVKKSLERSSAFMCDLFLSFSICSWGARIIYAKLGSIAARKIIIPGIDIASDKVLI